MFDVADKLRLLRNEMQCSKIDIYIIPSIDPHNSEYVPYCWQRRAWISDFDGSAGEVIITLDHAYLFTDGRYFLQAQYQLNSEYYTLIKQNSFVSEVNKWLTNNASDKLVGIDPALLSIARASKLHDILHGIESKLVFIPDNLVDKCRGIIDLPNGEAFLLSEAYTGESIDKKLAFIRSELGKHNADFIGLNVLDEIAWVFNMRGNDIEYNPLVISYAVIGKNDSWLFINRNKISSDLLDALTNAGVKLLDYDQLGEHLSNLHGGIWFDEKSANYSMLDMTSPESEVILAASPVVLAKSCKNHVEASGAENAHAKDAVAVINFLHWLDNNWQLGVTEMSCANKLSEFRLQQEHLKGMSFNAISGFAANGAIVHYMAVSKTDKIVDNSSLYLIDSGGQYLDGTTDITRTLHLGIPTPEQKRHYTLVLKGHLALGRAVFPHGTCGEHLDVLARNWLWQSHLNYAHGTGHGVGSFLCVHEGPQRISGAISNTPLLPGMIVSNEPGLYIAGEYGIRIENLCLIKDVPTNSEYGPFYYFETLTLVPYARKLIEIDLLDAEDIKQIKAYYAKIKSTLWDRLGSKQQQWLANELGLFS